MTGVNILQELSARDQERIRGYKSWLDFYKGRQWPGSGRWGEKRLTFNYARVFIDKLTSYLMSGINFTVEALEDTPEARAGAETVEKVLGQIYEANNLPQIDYETETDCAILGDGCYKVMWEGGGVRVTAPDVHGIYAWWKGDDISRVWKVASQYTLTEEEAEKIYGELKAESSKLKVPTPLPQSFKLQTLSSKLHTIIEVWTDDTFELYLDNTLLESRPNPYGFIPFIIFPNLREPKTFWGTSDIAPLVEPQRELNRAMSQISRILELSGNPVAVLENVEESRDIAVKPGAVWNIPEDAKAYLLDLLQGGGLQLHINYIELLYRALHDISETPRAAFGGTDSNLSGIAMQIELYPLLQKVMRKRTIRSAVYNQRNRMILKLLQKFQNTTNNSIENEVYHPSRRKPGSSSINISIFNPDRYRLRTVWGQVLPEDQARLVENEKILVETGVHSRRRAMDEVGVKDPEAEFRHWMEEQKEVMEIQNSKEIHKGAN